MGMFDWLICDVSTPDGWKPADNRFQTKSLNNEMVTHRITEQGTLVVEKVTDITAVPREERTYPDAPENSLLSLAGSLKFHTIQYEDKSFTGNIEFSGYELVENPQGNSIKVKGGWVVFNPKDFSESIDGKRWSACYHDYRAEFNAGKLQAIVLVDQAEEVTQLAQTDHDM